MRIALQRCISSTPFPQQTPVASMSIKGNPTPLSEKQPHTGVRAPAPTPVAGPAPAVLLKPSDLQLGTTPSLPTTTPGVRKIQSQLSALDRTPHPAQFLQPYEPDRQGHVRQVLRAQVHGADGVR